MMPSVWFGILVATTLISDRGIVSSQHADINKALWEKMHGYLFGAFTASFGGAPEYSGQDNTPLAPGAASTFLTLMRPGLPIDPAMYGDMYDRLMNPEGKNLHAEEYIGDNFAEVLPAMLPIHHVLPGTVSEYYGRVVKAQPTHAVTHSREEEGALAKYTKMLKKTTTRMVPTPGGGVHNVSVEVPSDMYNNYERYQDAYLEARDQYFLKWANLDMKDPQAQKEWALMAPMYHDKLNDRYHEFVVSGKKARIESAMAFYKQYEAGGVAQALRSARATFVHLQTPSSLHHGRSYSPSYIVPRNFFDKEADIWTRVSFNTTTVQRSSARHFDRVTTKTRHWGFFSHHTTTTVKTHEAKTHDCTTDKLLVSFSYTRAAIVRPWLQEIILTMPGWKILSMPPGRLSTGKVDESNTATLMPLLPESVILAKDFEIHADWSHEDSQYIRDSLKTKSFGVGFFSARRKSSNTVDTRMDVDATFVDNSLRGAKDPQVIGYISKVLPFLPPNG